MAEDTTAMPAAVDYPVDDRRRRSRGTQRRGHPRFTVVWTGRIVASSRSYDCVILNISAAGAKLRVFETLELPVRFTLIVDKFGDFPAELVWRDGRGAGIRFVGDPAQIGQTFASVLPVARLFSNER